MKSTRFSRPKGHFGTALTFSMPFGLLGLAAGLLLGHVWWGVALLSWAVATRLALSIAVGRMVVRDPNRFNLLVLYPVRDLMGFFFWASSYMELDSVAWARVSVAAGRKDARGEVGSTSVMKLRIHPLTSDLWPALEDLFGERGA